MSIQNNNYNIEWLFFRGTQGYIAQAESILNECVDEYHMLKAHVRSFYPTQGHSIIIINRALICVLTHPLSHTQGPVSHISDYDYEKNDK